MKLSEYFEQKKAPTTEAFAELSKVSHTTIKQARRGMRISKYQIAERISIATNGSVSIKELCQK